MEVRQGVSTEYGKQRFDITLDETDLVRLCNEYGVMDPSNLTTVQVYLLLTLEAERFCLVQAPKMGQAAASVVKQIRANREQFAGLLAEMTGLELAETRKRVGLVDAS